VSEQPELTTPYAGRLPPPPLEAGSLLAGRYRIVSPLGKGGMGEVFRADDLALGQPVALKLLPADLAADPDRLARFRKEVAHARAVSHPNVCRVYDLGEADGRTFLSMEFIDGEDLSSLLRRVGRLPEEKALEVARQLCSALAAVHEAGLLHRDLKPANVMLDGRGRVRLTDFGLAVVEGTAEDVRSGTPAYVAPEQADGREVTARSDVFSLGMVLHEVFTGRRPSPGEQATGLNPPVDAVVWRCLQQDPAQRPRSAAAILAALPGGDPLAAALAAGQTPSPQMVADAGAEGRLSPRVALACFAAVLALLVVVTLLAGKASVFNRVGLPEPPEHLARQARKAVEKLGLSPSLAHRAWGFETDGRLLIHLENAGGNTRHKDRLAEADPPPVYFWWRESPRALQPVRLLGPNGDNGNAGVASSNDPPADEPGMVSLRLRPTGELLALRAVPTSTAPAKAVDEPDWDELFALAGLDRQRFVPAEPTLLPPDHADVVRAWRAAEGGRQVAAAARSGRVSYFEVFGPASPPGKTAFTPQPAVGWEGGDDWFGVAWVLMLIVGGSALAFRNVLSGKSDRQGAARLFWVVLAAGVGGFLLRADWAGGATVLYQVMLGGATALLGAGLLWVYYVAIEPLARRTWPDSLISWSRLLAGRFTDPLVGRDVLVGLLAGVVVALFVFLQTPITHWAGHEQYLSSPTMLLRGRQVVGGWLLAVQVMIEIGTAYTYLAFLILLWITRRQSLAAIVYVLLLAWWQWLVTHSPVVTATTVVTSAIAVFLLVRFGLLASCVAAGPFLLLTSACPLTPDLSAWYAGYGLWTLALIAALAAWSASVAAGGRLAFVRPTGG
jgi:predicted Ser/Thr protein kinase